MSKILQEVTPLRDTDCFYMKDRYKDYFNYPMHCHAEMELNFVENCQGAMRVVGDSAEELGHVDLVLVGGGITHAWEQHRCRSSHIREVTFQFNSSLLGSDHMNKTAMESIRRMFDAASETGLAFSLPTIMRVYSKLLDLTVMESGFYRMLKFLEVLYDLSVSDGARRLHTPEALLNGNGNGSMLDAGDRLALVRTYIRDNYRKELRLADMAGLAGMTPAAFSRFFKANTGRSVTDYIIDMRLAEATRELVDTRKSVAEICALCGFNNVSNFNRLFKKKKGTSPNTFRHLYQQRKAIV